MAALPVQNINLPWDYTNDSVRSKACGLLNLGCFFPRLNPTTLSVSRGAADLFCTTGQALRGIFTFQNTEVEEQCEAQLIVKNLLSSEN